MSWSVVGCTEWNKDIHLPLAEFKNNLEVFKFGNCGLSPLERLARNKRSSLLASSS
jgi:hypothetical protein